MANQRPVRLLTIGHSYCVALNRRLAHEMARVGGDGWEVMAVAPALFPGDLRPIAVERFPGEACGLTPIDTYLGRRIHVMFYGARLRSLLRSGWDVVHCWEEPYVLAGAQVAAWAPRDASLVFATFQNISKRYPPPFNWMERFAMRRAAGWIAFGGTIERALADRTGYVDRPRRVIPLGVDVEHFRPSPERRAAALERLGWADDGTPVVGYLGRFVPEKGMEVLMRSLDRAAGSWRALLVGGGPMEEELGRWAERQGDRVRIVTGVPHGEVPGYLNAMDLLCAPSRTTPSWREQLGRMLLEAFASGVPVLATDSGEIPSVVADAGVVVAEADPDAWQRALDRLIADPAERRELAARGLERAHSTFAWPAIARRHLDFFTELRDLPHGDR